MTHNFALTVARGATRFLAAAAFVAGVSLSGQSAALAGTLTFEDLNPAPLGYDAMPTGYAGLTFTGWLYGPDTVYTPASGVIDLFTNYADPNDPGSPVVTNQNNEITGASPFYFEGAWFSGYSGVTFELWLLGVLIHSSDTLPDAPGSDPYAPTYLASGYAGLIDKIVVSGVQGYYAMDDFTFRVPDNHAVPAPSTAALLALAMATLLGVCQTRRRVRFGL